MNIIGTTRKTIKYELRVTGKLWGGGWGEYTYRLAGNQSGHPTTIEQCEPLCGDFEILEGADIIKTETETRVSEKAITT